MILAAVLMLGSISSAADRAALADLSPPPGLAETDAVTTAWRGAGEQRPGRDERSSFLCEEEDEDDSVDDCRSDLRHGFTSTVRTPSPGHLFAGHAPWQVTSRSASPTLRLRC